MTIFKMYVECYNMDQPRKYYAKEMDPVIKATYCMFTFIWNAQKKQIQRDRKQNGDCLGLEVSVGTDHKLA